MRTLVLVLLVLAGCLPKTARDRIEALEAHNADLEARVTALEAAKAPATAAQASEAAEAEAAALYQRATEAAQAMRADEARALLDQIDALGNTRVKRQADRLRTELAIVGQPAGTLDVDRWLQGYARPMDSGVTLLVFFEEWCPHCKRELPKLEQTQQEWRSRGLEVVALTKLTKSSTEESVMALVQEHQITVPVGVERAGAMSQRFAVSGIPAAALVKDGIVVWRGHPARITPEMLATLMPG